MGQCANNLLFSSEYNSSRSWSAPSSEALFSLALLRRYGMTSLTGPYGMYLYTR